MQTSGRRSHGTFSLSDAILCLPDALGDDEPQSVLDSAARAGKPATRMFVSMIAESRARCSSTNRFFSQHESLEEAEVRVAELERELIVTSDAYDRALTSLAISKKREERLVVQLASAENSAQRQVNKVESSAANQAATQQVSAERAAAKAKRKHARARIQGADVDAACGGRRGQEEKSRSAVEAGLGSAGSSGAAAIPF